MLTSPSDPAGTPTPSGSPSPSPSASPTPSPTPGSTTISAIEKLSGWGNCTGSCTNTAVAVYTMAQGVNSPALSGGSQRFQLLQGTKPFGAAMWFKYLGNLDQPTHFVLDLSFYVDDPSVSQGLEFTVSQSAGGSRYNFSTQCLLAGQNVWRGWDPIAHAWVASSAPCTPPQPNTWNHLTWEFERDSAGHVIFTAVTLNGNREMANLSMPHVGDSSTGLDVAFQPDANLNATPYSVWLDNITLTYW